MQMLFQNIHHIAQVTMYLESFQMFSSTWLNYVYSSTIRFILYIYILYRDRTLNEHIHVHEYQKETCALWYLCFSDVTATGFPLGENTNGSMSFNLKMNDDNK